MSADWIFDLESKIYSKVKRNVQDTIVAKFPNARFTTSGQSNGSSVFPCIYMHEIEGTESGRNLEESDINSYIFYMEIKVTVDTKRDDVRWILETIMPQFKKLGFYITAKTPVYTEANMYYQILRVRRVFSNTDSL